MSVKWSTVLPPVASGFPLAVVGVLGVEATRSQPEQRNRVQNSMGTQIMWIGVTVSRSSGHASAMILPLRNLPKHSPSKGSATAECVLRRHKAYGLLLNYPCIFSFSRWYPLCLPLMPLDLLAHPSGTSSIRYNMTWLFCSISSMRAFKIFICIMSPHQTMDYVLPYVLHIIYKN